MLDSVRTLEVGHRVMRGQRAHYRAYRTERKPLCSWLMPAYKCESACCSCPNRLVWRHRVLVPVSGEYGTRALHRGNPSLSERARAELTMFQWSLLTD